MLQLFVVVMALVLHLILVHVLMIQQTDIGIPIHSAQHVFQTILVHLAQHLFVMQQLLATVMVNAIVINVFVITLTVLVTGQVHSATSVQLITLHHLVAKNFAFPQFHAMAEVLATLTELATALMTILMDILQVPDAKSVLALTLAPHVLC